MPVQFGVIVVFLQFFILWGMLNPNLYFVIKISERNIKKNAKVHKKFSLFSLQLKRINFSVNLYDVSGNE